MLDTSRLAPRAGLLAAVLTITCFCSSAFAYPFGSPDTSFGTGGLATFLPSGWVYDGIEAEAVQPDGKIVVAGKGADSVASHGFVARFTASGALDTSFGTGGVFDFTSGGFESPDLEAIAIQPDGKIVVAGQIQNSIDSVEWQLLVRLNSDGTLDTNSDSTPASCFGSGCIGYVVSFAATGDSNLNDVKVLPGGDILAAGDFVSSGTRRLLVHRFNTDGVIDSTFNSNAATATGGYALSPGDPTTVRILLPTDNNLILAFGTFAGKFAAAELSPTGTIVSGYGAAGIAAVGAGVDLADAVLRPGGKVLFVGAKDTVTPPQTVAVGGVDETGETDASFGVDGTTTVSIIPGSRTNGRGIRVLADGRLFLSAIGFTPTSASYLATAVLSADGKLDGGYGSGGVIVHPGLGALSDPYALELLPGDKPLIAGVSASGMTASGFILKLHGPNDPDPVPAIVPGSKISTPSKSKYKAKKLRKFAGTGTPPGKIAKVEIALQRIDSKLLKRKKRCLWLSSNKAKFKKTKAVKKKCSSPKWLKAGGTDKWSYKLKKKLPQGSYVLSVRATATDGNVQAKPTTKKFRVTR
jgi:uncharacterized delta-60 repeat protein